MTCRDASQHDDAPTCAREAYDRAMRSLGFGLLLTITITACGASAPAPTTTTSAQPSTRFVSAGAMIQGLAPDADGSPRIRTRVMLIGADGEEVATLDLGETFSHASCASAEAPSIAESLLSVTFECGTLERIDYRVTLVDHRDHVAIWTFLADDGAGNWERMGDLYVPRGTRVRLLGEPIPATPAAALAAP